MARVKLKVVKDHTAPAFDYAFLFRMARPVYTSCVKAEVALGIRRGHYLPSSAYAELIYNVTYTILLLFHRTYFYSYNLIPVNETLVEKMGTNAALFYQLANDTVRHIVNSPPKKC